MSQRRRDMFQRRKLFIITCYVTDKKSGVYSKISNMKMKIIYRKKRKSITIKILLLWWLSFISLILYLLRYKYDFYPTSKIHIFQITVRIYIIKNRWIRFDNSIIFGRYFKIKRNVRCYNNMILKCYIMNKFNFLFSKDFYL